MVRKTDTFVGNNVTCVVFHDKKLLPLHRQKLKCLYKIFDHVNYFSDIGKFAAYIGSEFIVDRLVFIISSAVAKYLFGLIETRKNKWIRFDYELQYDTDEFQSELSAEKKFRSVEKLIEKICLDIPHDSGSSSQVQEMVSQNDVHVDDEKVHEQSTLLFGISGNESPRPQESFSYLSHESLRFFLFQIFIKALLRTEMNNEDIDNMWNLCREKSTYDSKSAESDKIDRLKIEDLKRRYSNEIAVTLYTENCCLFRNLNKALRCENIEEVFVFRPFIKHLLERLDELAQKPMTKEKPLPDVVYRGKKLPKSVLQQLRDNINKYISINGFLSTSTKLDVATVFSDYINQREGYETVVFELSIGDIGTNTATTHIQTYADISAESAHPDEDEVLFSMGFVWIIESVEYQSNKKQWRVILKLSTDNNAPDNVRFNLDETNCNDFTLGKILHELGEYKEAQSFYRRMLKSCPDFKHNTRADIHFHIAESAYAEQRFDIANEHLQKARDAYREQAVTESSDPRPICAEYKNLSMVSILTNMGLANQKLRDKVAARSSFNEALRVEDGSDNDKAQVYYCMGVLESECGNYEEAHDYYNKGHALVQNGSLKKQIERQLKFVKDLLNI